MQGNRESCSASGNMGTGGSSVPKRRQRSSKRPARRRKTPATPLAALQANAGGGEAPPGHRSAAARALLRRRPPPLASRRRGSSGQGAPPPRPPPPLPPLQPFGPCVTRRFLPTWRQGQVGGGGGWSAVTAGANPHSSQGSPALAGPLRRRCLLVPPPAADGRPRSEGRVRWGGREATPAARRSGGPTGAALQGRPLAGRRSRRPSPAPRLVLPAPS